MIELSYANLIRLENFICDKIAESEDIDEVRNYRDLKYLVDDRMHEKEQSDEKMDEEPKQLTEYDIIHLVGKPLWCEYGTCKEWKILKEIYVKKGSQFILNFTDGYGGIDFSDTKLYQGEP